MKGHRQLIQRAIRETEITDFCPFFAACARVTRMPKSCNAHSLAISKEKLYCVRFDAFVAPLLWMPRVIVPFSHTPSLLYATANMHRVVNVVDFE